MVRALFLTILSAMLCGSVVAHSDAKPPMRGAKPAPRADRAAQKEAPIRARVVTNMGTIVLELDAKKAPITVENFLRYVEARFYDRTVIHRVIPDFLIQGGGYTTASLLPKAKGLHPPIKNEWNNGLKNTRLTVGAARIPGKPDSATCQFYINLVDNPRLDQAQDDGAGYAVFGRVVFGEGAVERIRDAEVRVHSRYRESHGKPVTPSKLIVIQSIRRIDAQGKVIEPKPEPGVQPEFPDELEAGRADLPEEDGLPPRGAPDVEPPAAEPADESDETDVEPPAGDVDEQEDSADAEPPAEDAGELEDVVDMKLSDKDADGEDAASDLASTEENLSDEETAADEDKADDEAVAEDDADTKGDTEGEAGDSNEEDAQPGDEGREPSAGRT